MFKGIDQEGKLIKLLKNQTKRQIHHKNLQKVHINLAVQDTNLTHKTSIKNLKISKEKEYFHE